MPRSSWRIPSGAAALDPGDATRIARALEVVRSTGKPLTHWQKQREGGIAGEVALHPAILLPPREQLYQRCDGRFARMLDGGAVAEVETLLARKLDPRSTRHARDRVPEVAALLRGETGRDEVHVRGAQATRNYAKRQYTWARHQFPPHWPRFESHDYPLERYFESLLLN